MHDQQLNEREEYDSFVIPPAAATPDAPDGDDTEDDGQPVQIIEQDGKRQLVAYAVVWGAVSSPRRDGFRHRFARGSIVWTDPTTALWHHDYGTPLSSTANTTLKIEEDDYGAKATIDLDQTTDGTNAYQRVKDRLVTGMSFGGRRVAYDRTDDPKVIDVTRFIADEISLTILPAMTETNVVTSDKANELKNSSQAQKEYAMKSQKDRLDKFRLALLRP
ncbi:MAG TPA: HK97 family phage prohead protease [Tepidisphaeraceae bacterium]|jgi:HK97 family phage prohead protease|nr:HK97 family phage prohead protease [Tepidisphaeraceae bacterium]